MTSSAAPARPDAAPALPRFLTVKDLAEAFGMTDRAARYTCERGEIPAFRVGRSWFIRPEALAEFIARGEEEARTGPAKRAEALRDALAGALRKGRRSS